MPSTNCAALRRFFCAGSPETSDSQANKPSNGIGQPNATTSRRISPLDKQDSTPRRSPQHRLAEFLPPRTPPSRATESPSNTSKSVRGERPHSVSDLPQDVLRKLGADLRSRPGVINLALVSPSLQSALLPVAKGEKLDFLKELARSARDLESVRLVLRSSRSLPNALHIALIEELIASLPDLAKADGSFFQMQAAAADASEGFKLVANHIAELPGPQRAGLSVALAPHLKLLPVDERFGAMETLLQETRKHASHHNQLEMISCFALGMGQFNYPDLPRVTQILIDQAATLPFEERQKLEQSFRMGMNCKMLDADSDYIEQLLVGLVKKEGPSASR